MLQWQPYWRKQLIQVYSGNHSNNTQNPRFDWYFKRSYSLSALPWTWLLPRQQRLMPLLCPELMICWPLPPWRHTEQGAPFYFTPPDLELLRQKCQSINKSWSQTFPGIAGVHFLLKSNRTEVKWVLPFASFVMWGKLLNLCEPQCVLWEMGQ